MNAPGLWVQSDPRWGGPLFRDSAGLLYPEAGSGRAQVGITLADGSALLAVDSRGRVVAWADAVLGELRADRTEPIRRVAPATLAASNGGQRATLGPERHGVLEDGTILMTQVTEGRRTRWSTQEPPSLVGRLRDDHELRMRDGHLSVRMTFRLSDEAAPTSRWVSSSHTVSESGTRRAQLAEEAARAPASLRTDIQDKLVTMTAVSVLEGSFGSRAIPEDTHVSLGIFQWAMPRTETSPGGLGTMLRTLQQRSLGSDDVSVLARQAWNQVTAAGVTLGADTLQIGGAAATGNQVDAALGPVFGTGALRTWQLVAARDLIDSTMAQPVRLTVSAERWWTGLGVTDLSGGAMRLSWGGAQLRLDPPGAVTRVSQLFTSARDVGSALVLAVNRPAYVGPAAWRAMHTTDPVPALLQAVQDALAACRAAGAEPRGGYRWRELRAAGPAGVDAADRLTRLLWPTAPAPGPELRRRFEAAAMSLYAARDARRFNRAGRFVNVEAVMISESQAAGHALDGVPVPPAPALTPARIRATRDAYRLSLRLTVDGQARRLAVQTPYHISSRRGGHAAPGAAHAPRHARDHRQAHAAVALGKGAPASLTAVMQEILDDHRPLRDHALRAWNTAVGRLRQADPSADAGKVAAAGADGAGRAITAWMGENDIGIDCSGFVLEVTLQDAGIRAGWEARHPRESRDKLALDRSSVGLQTSAAHSVPLGVTAARPGDIVANRGRGHIGVVEEVPREITLVQVVDEALRARIRSSLGDPRSPDAEVRVWHVYIAHSIDANGSGDTNDLPGPHTGQYWYAADGRLLAGLDQASGGFVDFFRLKPG